VTPRLTVVRGGGKLSEHGSPRPPTPPLRGGRAWWAHLEFSRINIELTILQKEIEESLRNDPKTSRVGKCIGYLDLRAFQGERQADFWPFLAFSRAGPRVLYVVPPVLNVTDRSAEWRRTDPCDCAVTEALRSANG
jgi:hypothetical protein